MSTETTPLPAGTGRTSGTATSKNSYFDHVKVFRNAVRAAGGEALLAFESMNVFVRKGGTHWLFHPKFMAESEGVRRYTTAFTDDTTMFAGWLPYQMKRWQAASDKLVFKRYAQAAGLRTPPYWLSPEEGAAGVLAKRAASSFGAQIRGPFRSSQEHALDVAQGEFFERFIPGRILKIWFLEALPLCAEIDEMPAVVGDGASTLAKLITRRANRVRPRTARERDHLLASAESVLRFSGLSLTDVLPKGARQLVEFRYGSTIQYRGERRNLDLTQPQAEQWTTELRDVGTKLFLTIPAETRDHAVYTVDAILDDEGCLWLLEMNCNPTVHPLAYPAIIDRLLSSEAATAGAASPQMSPSATPALVQ